MRLLNMLMYYVAAPALVIQLFLIDFGILTFQSVIHLATLVIFFVLVAITSFYKKNHPNFDFKVNDLYEKMIFVLIIMEVVFINFK